MGSTRAEIAKLVATAPLARQQAEAYHALVADRYVARNDYLEKEQTALDKEHELAAQQSHAGELAAAIAEQRAQVEVTASKFRRDQLDELEKATQQLTQSRADESKAQTREALLSLTAPVAGTVQQLAVHTLGGVVTTAQLLMEIVPDDGLEVEARLQNRDIGFVEVGQSAAVKVEAFPYTRYGYLNGTITEVSNDAVQDKKLGPTFPVRIRLEEKSRIRVDNRWITLTPGMAVTADISTGKRSVLEYFLDPLLQTAQESMRERYSWRCFSCSRRVIYRPPRLSIHCAFRAPFLRRPQATSFPTWPGAHLAQRAHLSRWRKRLCGHCAAIRARARHGPTSRRRLPVSALPARPICRRSRLTRSSTATVRRPT